MRILLVSPWATRHFRFRSLLSVLIDYPALSLPIVKGLIPAELNAEVLIYDELAHKTPPSGPFDVVGITAVTSVATRAYEIAEKYRAEGACVVMGGIHPSAMPTEALAHADAVVVGEGLDVWPQILRDVAEGREVSGIYQDSGITGIEVTPDRSIVTFPPYSPVDTVIASPGCPKQCSFCSIAATIPFYHRPIESVIRDLRTLKRKRLILTDPNFFMDRRYALDLLKQMEPLGLKWGTTATIDFGFDDELMDAARRAGCIGVLIGFESFTPAALKHVKKRSVDPSRYKEAIRNIHSRQITVNGPFIVGLDGDTEESLEALPQAVNDLGVDMPLFFVLTPFPGTPLFAEMKAAGRVLTEDWSRYDQNNVVFQPESMSPARLAELYKNAWRGAYSFSAIFKRVFRASGLSPINRFVVLWQNIGFKYMGQH